MAEISFLPPSAEMLSAASGTPVAATAGAVDGIFSGMLAQRLQPRADSAQNVRNVDAPVPASPADGIAKMATANSAPGQASPSGGKALPADAAVTAQADEELDALEPLPTAVLAGEASVIAQRVGQAPLLPAGAVLGKLASGALPEASVANIDATSLSDLKNAAALLTPSAGAVAQQTADITAALPRGTETASAAESRLAQERLLPQTALQLARMDNEPAAASRTPASPLAASLGLNANGDVMAKGQAALNAEQMLRNGAGSVRGSIEQIPNQALIGESLSRQFQQQIDRMLASSRGTVSEVGSLNAALSKPATDSLAGGTLDTSPGVVLPGMETRVGTVNSPLSAVTVPVSTGVGQPGWSADLGQRMVWLANQEIREAKIQLNPRHLGPIDVRIVYSDAQQLSVSIHAQNPAAREALNAALPRLQEMFDQQGLNLADANVFDGNASQHFSSEQRQHAENTARGADEEFAGTEMLDAEPPPLRDPMMPIGLGMLDTFA